MNQQDFQPYLDIAISVLGKKDAGAVAKLKAFLVSLPGPAYIEQVLGLAVVYFAEHDSTVFDWLVSNPTMLSPELNLKKFTQKTIEQRLKACGCADGKGVAFESETVWLSSQEKLSLLERTLSEGELKLLHVAFALDSSYPPTTGRRL